MSKADDLFVSMCTDILENGTTTEGQKVRPHWEDGAPAYTIKQFGVVNRYDLRDEFPALTLRRTALKSCMDEVLWIYQRKSNNIHDLKSHIWDEWADETGSIGKAYGYQIAQKSRYPEGDFDQMDRVLFDLERTPYSRRIMTNTYVFHDLSEMNLYPCAYSCTYNVTQHVDREAHRKLGHAHVRVAGTVADRHAALSAGVKAHMVDARERHGNHLERVRGAHDLGRIRVVRDHHHLGPRRATCKLSRVGSLVRIGDELVAGLLDGRGQLANRRLRHP